MTTRKPPRLLQSGLTGRIYIATAYKDFGGGRVVADTKFDVTEEFEAIGAEDREYLAVVEGQRARALAAIERVHALHVVERSDVANPWCASDKMLWPCPTIRALDPPPADQGPEGTRTPGQGSVPLDGETGHVGRHRATP